MKKIKFEIIIDASDVTQLEATIAFMKTIGGMQTAAPKSKETTAAPATTKTENKETAAAPETTKTEKKVNPLAIKAEDVRALVAKKVNPINSDQDTADANRKAVKAKLTELGVQNVPKIEEKDYFDFVEFLNTLK